jgi:hypothetical protein
MTLPTDNSLGGLGFKCGGLGFCSEEL